MWPPSMYFSSMGSLGMPSLLVSKLYNSCPQWSGRLNTQKWPSVWTGMPASKASHHWNYATSRKFSNQFFKTENSWTLKQQQILHYSTVNEWSQTFNMPLQFRYFFPFSLSLNADVSSMKNFFVTHFHCGASYVFGAVVTNIVHFPKDGVAARKNAYRT